LIAAFFIIPSSYLLGTHKTACLPLRPRLCGAVIDSMKIVVTDPNAADTIAVTMYDTGIIVIPPE
jgi:hypothetical protein